MTRCWCITSRTAPMKVTPAQRRELEAIVARRNEAAGLVRRARVILLSDDGVSRRAIALRLDLAGGGLSDSHSVSQRHHQRARRSSEGRPQGPRGACRYRRAHRGTRDVAASGRPQSMDRAPARQGSWLHARPHLRRSAEARTQAASLPHVLGQPRPELRREGEGRRRPQSQSGADLLEQREPL